MERMKIAAVFADGDALGGKEITVCGWARTIRDMKTFGFIELNDGSCFKNLQVVMSAEELANYYFFIGEVFFLVFYYITRYLFALTSLSNVKTA